MTTATVESVPLPKFVTLDQLHEACGGKDIVSRRTLERMAQRGLIPGAEKVGRAWLFKRLLVTAWIDGSAVGARVAPVGGAR